MAKNRKRRAKPPKTVLPKKEIRPPIDLGELWLRVRSGAANVAGVRYQLAITAFMLTGARAALELEEVAPEGLEDIDCRLADTQLLLVQAKERAEGEARFSLTHVRAALNHAADALRLDPQARFALVTDAELAGGLAETGFELSVADGLPQVMEKLVQASDPPDRIWLTSALARTHIVRLEWVDVHEQTRRRLQESYQLPPALAEIAYATLLEELAAAAAGQRKQTRETARRFRSSDLDALVHRLRRVVDVESLTRAERDGIIEPVDFTRPIVLTPERFLLGVDVEPGHIAAGLDVIRADELDEIFVGLREDQYCLIAGPSGAGKSALLWRAAYELAGRFRLLRLRRVESPDVTELLRYVEGQRPSLQAPVLICGDDLGRPSLAGWEDTVDRLLELPGVFILGAVREEDFRSSLLRGRAKVVRPILNRRLAVEIMAQLERREVSFVLEPDEAFARADGLLMEFLALLISGRRLRDIVRTQVEERLAPDRVAEREVLRYVATSHVYAMVLPASALLTLVPFPAELPVALQRLEDEFLVHRLDASRWSGLHELRSRAVVTRLHELPPPSVPETLAQLLRVVERSDQRTLIVAAAQAGHDLSPLEAIVEELFATHPLDAAAIYTLLDGFIEAEELNHARACLDLIHKWRPAFDAVSLLPFLQAMRDGLVASFTGLPSLDALADALPARAPSIATAIAARLPESRIIAAVAASPPLQTVELLELLAFLGRSLPTSPVQALIERARVNGDTAIMTRAIAVSAQATPESRQQLEHIAGTLESRLDAIAEFRRDVFSWELSGPADKKTVNIRATEYGDGKLNDRLVGICRLVYEGCPEVEQVTVEAVAADGNRSILPNAQTSPARRYVPNPIRQNSRNIGFQKALLRLTAADSWTERLRRQEELVHEIATALEETIPRLLNPHDNRSRIRSWLEKVERIRLKAEQLPAVPLPASVAVDRADRAKGVLDRASFALNQLARGVENDSLDNLWGFANLFQAAFGEAQVSSETAVGASAEAKDWPIVRRLIVQVEDLRASTDLLASLLLALNYDKNLLHRVSRGSVETWKETATRVITRSRDVLLQEERAALESTVDGLPCKLWRVKRTLPGQVLLVSDSWLLVCELEHWLEAGKRLLSLPEQIRFGLGFRTYIAAAVDGLVVPVFTRMFGSHDFKPFLYPVSPGDAAALAEEAGIEYLRSPHLDEALRLIDALVQASSLAALYRLRNERFSREPERTSATAAIANARKTIEEVRDTNIRANLTDALALVEAELEGPYDRSLAASIQNAAFRPTDEGARGPVAAVIQSAIFAALREHAASHQENL